MISKPKQILVVEDSKAEAYLLVQTVRQLLSNSKVVVCVYGKDVMSFLKCNEHSIPHLIILDLVLPDINGKEILNIIKSHPTFSKIPIMVRSGFSSSADEDHCFQLGADWYFEKAKDLDQLEQQMGEVIHHLFGKE